MRLPRARAGAAAALVAGLAATPAAAAGDVLRLPKPTGEVPVIAEAFADRPDRLRRSILPGPVDDTERIEIRVAPDGAPAEVTMRQRLVLRGTGQFVVWQRSSAQDVEALEDTTAPVLKREAVIWQGFVDRRKVLAAKLTLNPAVEAELLPLGVTVEWRGTGAVGPGGTLPGPGEVVVRLRNRTARAMTVPTGDVAPEHLAGPLDTLLAHANRRTASAPPVAGRGLPATLPAKAAPGRREASTVAPLRITGTITVDGANVTADGPGSTPAPGGLAVDGVLQGDAEFVLRPNGASRLVLDLTASPTVDPRLVRPPRGRTWKEWLARKPLPNETRDAVLQLVDATAAAARADEYQPYLGHHGPGTVSTTYHVAFAPPEVLRAAADPLRPKAFPIALAGVALLAVLANTTALWRRL